MHYQNLKSFSPEPPGQYQPNLPNLALNIPGFLLVWGFTSHSRIFHSYEGLQILTYARHSWPLSSEGSLPCHTYCDTVSSVYNGHLRGPVTLTPIAERLAVELSLSVFTRFVAVGIRTPNLPLAKRTLHRLRHRGGSILGEREFDHVCSNGKACLFPRRDNKEIAKKTSRKFLKFFSRTTRPIQPNFASIVGWRGLTFK